MLEQYMLNAFKLCGMEDEYLEFFGSPKCSAKPAKIYDGYKLPIEYLDAHEIHTLSNTVIDDLELDKLDKQSTPSMYDELCMSKHTFAKQMVSEFKCKYTSNASFLRDTQTVVDNMKHYPSTMDKTLSMGQLDCDQFLEMWQDLKDDAEFLEKYSFMEWKVVEGLNHSSEFLQTWSVINILSPLTSFLIPIIFFIFPFVLLRLKGVPITFDQYLETLREIAKHHFIGKVLNIKSISFENLVYLIFTGGLYFLQMYQNTMSCIRFYNNVQKMNQYLVFIRTYTNHNILKMSLFIKHNGHLPTYAKYCGDVYTHLNTLTEIHAQLERISPFQINVSKCLSVGYMLQQYYQLHSNEEYEAALRYSVGFEGYISNLEGIYKNKLGGFVNNAEFGKTYTKITQQYYPVHKFLKPVKNNCKLEKSMIITGVNASGKTTFLKTTAINIIFTQQFGMGFYDDCVLVPYTHIHSYLNIPDTSGRDSLFQAESRRCKEIIDAIQQTDTSKTRHFCIFDELYSGTNPKEASKSAYSFLHYLAAYNNVDFILTTHYVKVCKKLKKHKRIANYKMDVIRNENGELHYTYQIKKGITSMEGGVEILKQMNYPKEIIDHIQNQKR
jgi:hypothetical protein